MDAIIQRGQIWYAHVPYNDVKAVRPSGISVETGKVRPVVVLGWSEMGRNDDHNILVVPVTTFDHGNGAAPRLGDIKISEPSDCGMDDGSHIRSRRAMTLHPHAFDFDSGCCGSITNAQLSQVLTEVSKFFADKVMQKVPQQL